MHQDLLLLTHGLLEEHAVGDSFQETLLTLPHPPGCGILGMHLLLPPSSLRSPSVSLSR